MSAIFPCGLLLDLQHVSVVALSERQGGGEAGGRGSQIYGGDGNYLGFIVHSSV